MQVYFQIKSIPVCYIVCNIQFNGMTANSDEFYRNFEPPIDQVPVHFGHPFTLGIRV